MSEVNSSFRNAFKMLNPYPGPGGVKDFISDARKEGFIKPIFYGLAVGAGAFDVSTYLGKNLLRKPIENNIIEPIKRIMGLNKPVQTTLKDKVLDIIQSPEVTFGLSSGAGAALTMTGLYGAHHLLKRVVSRQSAQKDEQKP